MISSKRITLFAFILTGMVVVLTFVAILFPDELATEISTGTIEYSNEHKISLMDNDYYAKPSSSDDIVLSGNTAATNSRNVQIEGNEIIILGGGYYTVTGEITDGSIIINSEDANPVFLMLDSASITSSDFSAIYVKQATKVIISAKSGTTNYLTDASEYNEEKQTEEKPDAVIYSKDDLTINGDGILNITGNYADGIKANDDLKIIGANINVTTVDEGINANNYAYISDSSLNITSGGDGIKCEEEINDKGFVVVENSKIDITSGGDGVSASSSAYIKLSDFNIVSGGGAQNAQSHHMEFGGFDRREESSEETDSASTKGIKAVNNLNITDGSFNIDSSDDALHTDNNLNIKGGSFVILSGDDAVHAGNTAILEPQSIDIQKCYEGIEGAFITINGGEIKINSSDDGINATGLNSTSGMPPMMMNNSNQAEKTADEDVYLILNGGNIYIEASGDGFDSNGSAVINGGTLQIYGPENSGNGSIDVGDGGYVLIINGGTLFAAGSSGMAESPHDSSTQNTLVFYLDEYKNAGSEIMITDSDGNIIISETSDKKFNWICLSDEKLTVDKTYTLKINGEEIASLECTGAVAEYGNQRVGRMR
ncbi:MAG: carbohydrate-binding domain-containing protein [Clostridia bacterium]|nr:carbohydrate-binding domain-containing protein [Clostridia bacterium]